MQIYVEVSLLRISFATLTIANIGANFSRLVNVQILGVVDLVFNTILDNVSVVRLVLLGAKEMNKNRARVCYLTVLVGLSGPVIQYVRMEIGNGLEPV
jgi:hypothetical protein